MKNEKCKVKSSATDVAELLTLHYKLLTILLSPNSREIEQYHTDNNEHCNHGESYTCELSCFFMK